MKLHSFKVFFNDAFKNIIKNRLMSIATIFTLSAGLFLFGLATAITLNVFSVTNKLQTDFKLACYINEDCTQEQINEISRRLRATPNVSAIEFVSKEVAFEEFKKQFSDTDILEGIDTSDILRHSYKITLTSLEFSKEVTEQIKAIPGVSKVTDMDQAMSQFMDVSKKLQMGTSVISLILALLSVLIITNTINMSIFSRRKQINIMKYVGATDWYIRWPFILEGLLIGIIAAIISFLGVYYLYDALIGVTGSAGQTMGIISKSQATLPILSIIFGTGLFLGAIGSILSIRKHLKV